MYKESKYNSVFHILKCMENSVDPEQLASLGSTVFKSMYLVSQVHYHT